ncbi:MAG: sulfatase [Verrucomicrobiales bacterium]|nr:sulfatase [Verrucomicrobiales bacterium]
MNFQILFCLLAFFGLCATALSDDRPNIVYILCDDLGYGDLGCFGQDKILTPELDQMAAEGMIFTQHYSGSTVCAPSRSCLMTGQHTGHTYMRGNGNYWLRPDPQDKTVASYLQESGYRTAMIGKSCTSGVPPEEFSQPNKKGFDHFFGVLGHKEAHHYHPPRVYRNGEAIDLPGNHEHEGDNFAPDLFLKEAKEWIEMESETEEPFFLLYSAPAPHASLSAPEEWIAKYRGEFPEREVVQKHYRSTNEPNATFAAMVSRLDWEVGQLIDTLRACNLDENTVVIFTSDNGAQSAGGHSENDFNSSGPLRGEKRDMYEGGIRTPFIVRWPSVIPGGTKSDHISAFWDFLPTACELAGVAPPKGIDGISYAPTLLQNPDEQKQHDYLYWEFFEKGGKRAVRMGDWKAVQNDVIKTEGKSPIELYDIKNDLDESENIADQHPKIVEKARNLFQTARTRSPIEKFNFPDNP